MASRILRNAEDVDGFVKLLCALKLPVTVTWQQGADRSHDQNALQWLWATEVATQLGDREAADVQAEWKLEIGVPILRADDPDFRAAYDKAVRPLRHTTKPAKSRLPSPVTRGSWPSGRTPVPTTKLAPGSELMPSELNS